MICSNCKTSITLPFAVDKCPNCGFILDKKSKNDIITIDNPFNQNKVLNKVSFEIGAKFLSKYSIDQLMGFHYPFSFYEISLEGQSFILQLYSVDTELHKNSIDIFNFLFSKYPYLPDKLVNMYEYGIYDKDVVYFIIENYPQNSLESVLNSTANLSYEYIINLMFFTLDFYEEINSPHLFLSPKEIISMGDNRFKVKNYLTIRFLANMIEPSFFFNEDRDPYMAPELKSGMLILTKKADLFSIGKIWERVLNLGFLSQSDEFIIFKEKIDSIIEKMICINPDNRGINIETTKEFLNSILTEVINNELIAPNKLSLASLEIEVKDDADFEVGISTSLDLKDRSFEEKVSDSIKFGDNEFEDDEVTSDLQHDLLEIQSNSSEDVDFNVSLEIEEDAAISSFSNDDFENDDLKNSDLQNDNNNLEDDNKDDNSELLEELSLLLEDNIEKSEPLKEEKEFNLVEEVKSLLVTEDNVSSSIDLSKDILNTQDDSEKDKLNVLLDDGENENEDIDIDIDDITENLLFNNNDVSSSIDLSKDIFNTQEEEEIELFNTQEEEKEIELFDTQEEEKEINIDEDILFHDDNTSSSIDLSKDIFNTQEDIKKVKKEINKKEEIEIEIDEGILFNNDDTSSSIDLSKDIFDTEIDIEKVKEDIDKKEIKKESDNNNIYIDEVSYDNENSSSSIDLSKDIFGNKAEEIDIDEEIEIDIDEEIEIDIDEEIEIDIDEEMGIDEKVNIKDLEKLSTSNNFDFENLSGSFDFSKDEDYESISSSINLEDEPTYSYDQEIEITTLEPNKEDSLDKKENSLEDKKEKTLVDKKENSLEERENFLKEILGVEEDLIEIELDELEEEHSNIFKEEDDVEDLAEEITIVELEDEDEEIKKITIKNKKVKNPPKLKVTSITNDEFKTLREALKKKPLDLEKMKKVYAYYVENNEIDKAYVISNILNFMNELSDSELIFKNGRKFQWEYNENILTEENLALLFTKEIYLNTSGVMIVLKDFLHKKKHLVSTVIPPLTTSSPIALRSRKGKIIKDLIDLTGLKSLRLGTTKDISSNNKVFSVLYQKKSHTHLTVRKDIFEELDMKHFKVIMAKYMFLAHPEIIPNFIYDVPTIEEVFYGTMKFTIPFIREMHDSKLSNGVHEELSAMKKTKSLSQKDIIKLVIVMNEHFAQRKQYPDIKTSLKNIEIISDRFALLASNDLNSTLKTFLNYKDINIRLNPRERMNALLKFVMSDEYFQLRKNLKQSVSK